MHHAGDGDDRTFLSHATGFCGAAFGDLPERFAAATWWDFRGHGRSGRSASRVSWWEMALDPAAVRDATACARAVGVGHSMGGATLLMAELEQPGRFDGLVLVEPIVFPPPYRRQDHPLAQLARKRRGRFADREEARANFAAKPPFASWAGRALDGYLAEGLRDDCDGVTLACAPSFEAELYTAASAHGVLARLGEIRCPVAVVVGGRSDTYGGDWARRFADSFRDARLTVVDGASHFVPMEVPEAVADAVSAMWRRIDQKAE